MEVILFKVLIVLLLTYILEAIYIFVNLMSTRGHIKFVNKNKEIELKGLKKCLAALLISSLWLFVIIGGRIE